MSTACIHLLMKFALWHCCFCLSSQADLNLFGLNRPDQLMLWDLLALIPTTIIYRDSNLQDLHVTASIEPAGMTNKADRSVRTPPHMQQPETQQQQLPDLPARCRIDRRNGTKGGTEEGTPE